MSQEVNWAKEEEGDQMEKLEENVQNGSQVPMQKRKNKKRVILNPKQSTGHWSDQEHKTYIDFLNAHRPIMESQDQKKTSKIFKLMSEIIGTRSPSQCRSHHQKFNPFVHQIKKRQKGAGRKRKDMSVQNDKMENRMNFDNSVLQQFFFQQQFHYPQQFVKNSLYPQDYSMMQMQQYPMMYQQQLIENLEKIDEKQSDNPLFFPPYLLPPSLQTEDKNMCYNFSLMHPQVQLNFNYYQPADMNPTLEKDNQFEEQ